MAFDQAVGTTNLRATTFDSAIKQITPGLYKFKQATAIVPTSAWKNYFFREDPDVLAGQSGNNTKGIPRGAAFPQASVSLERVSTIIEKYGLEENIPWEDLISDEVDIGTRTAIKISEGVAKAVDDEIWDTLTSSQVRADYVAQSIIIAEKDVEPRYWDVASAAIIDDLLEAAQKIAEKKYPTDNLICFVSPKDKRSVLKYLTDKGAQFPKIGESTALNGSIGKLAGINIVESISVTASFALVVVPKRVATWRQMVPLSSMTKEDKFKSTTYRAVEVGVTEFTDPNAAVIIEGTQDPA